MSPHKLNSNNCKKTIVDHKCLQKQSVRLKVGGHADPERYPFQRQKNFPGQGSESMRKRC